MLSADALGAFEDRWVQVTLPQFARAMQNLSSFVFSASPNLGNFPLCFRHSSGHILETGGTFRLLLNELRRRDSETAEWAKDVWEIQFPAT